MTKDAKESAHPGSYRISPATQSLIEKGRRYYMQNYKPRDVILDRGVGARVWDLDGNEYIDLGAGIAVTGLGHHNDALLKVLKDQAEKLWHTSNIFFTEPPILLAEELVTASKFAQRVFFCNSGGEANEAAIKLARKYAAGKGKPPSSREIVTFQGSFHGRTLATVTATAQPKYQEGFEPLPGGFVYAPFNDFAALKNMVGEQTCAIMLETIQGEGGITPVKPGYLAQIRQLCDKFGALLIIDDIQAGMGRTGKLFSHWMEPDFKPDVVTLAKGLGGGMPIGAMLVGEKAAETFQFGSHGSTFGGNPMACAVAREVLKALQSDALMNNVEARSKQLKDALEKLNAKYSLFTEIRGLGLMIGAELDKEWHGKAGEIGDVARKHGLLVLQAGPNVLRFVPALVITEAELTEGLKRLDATLEAFLKAA